MYITNNRNSFFKEKQAHKHTHRIKPEFHYWCMIEGIKLSCDWKPLGFCNCLHVMLSIRTVQNPYFFEHFLILKQYSLKSCTMMQSAFILQNTVHMHENYHWYLFRDCLEVVFTVFHGHLMCILRLWNMGHFCLCFVFQHEYGRGKQDTQYHLKCVDFRVI